MTCGLVGFAERVAQHDLAQPALRGGRPVRRGGGGAIGGERFAAAAQPFGEPAGEHGDLRLELGRHADRFEIVEQRGGGGEDRRPRPRRAAAP